VSDQSLSDALGRVATAPPGPQVGAFFDLDGTLVDGFTAGAFYGHRIRSRQVGAGELLRTAALVADHKLGGDQAKLGDMGVAGLRGQTEEDLAELGERLFVQRTAGTMRPQARELVRAHQQRGHTVVIASSATRFQVDPIARDLGIESVLCSQLEVSEGLLTGRFAGGMMWGEAKARAVRDFARGCASGRPVDLAASFAYGNGAEDVPFLSSVGAPMAVNPHVALRRVAELQDWPVLDLTTGQQSRLRATIGTVAALAGLNVGMGAGIAIGRLRGDQRLGADLACSLGFSAFLAAAGVRLEIVGAHNLWAARPAVFVMNHQSGLDAMVIGALLRDRFSGLAKKEARYSPATYLTGRALNAVFVDRSDPMAAREQLSMLEDRVREGLSVFVAPEGTRSPTPVLGPFRTGAFRVAVNTGVPIVPVVLRNTWDLMPGTAKTIRPGTVDVAVLPPVETRDWSLDSLRQHVDDVRKQFEHTLDVWPGTRS
jgi:putative phosphoserine phosphatase/1-acylglycerol-3-phosphate O-acyltransferase